MLAIIIINYNNYNKTIDCVKSIINSTIKDYKIYLLDNNSQNDSYNILKEEFDKLNNIEIIKSNENLGYARGNNLCINKAVKDGYEYALISNNDIIYENNTIDRLYGEIKENNYFIIAPKIVLPDGRIQKSNKIFRKSFFYFFLHETYLNKFFKDNNYENKEKREVYWVAGCSFIVNLELFKNIGYFDNNTFLFYEEYIIAEKARNKNFKICYFPDVKAMHFHGASMGNLNLKVYLERFKSEIYFWHNYRHTRLMQLYILYLFRKIEMLYSLNKEHRINEFNVFRKEIRKIFNKEVHNDKIKK